MSFSLFYFLFFIYFFLPRMQNTWRSGTRACSATTGPPRWAAYASISSPSTARSWALSKEFPSYESRKKKEKTKNIFSLKIGLFVDCFLLLFICIGCKLKIIPLKAEIRMFYKIFYKFSGKIISPEVPETKVPLLEKDDFFRSFWLFREDFCTYVLAFLATGTSCTASVYRLSSFCND